MGKGEMTVICEYCGKPARKPRLGAEMTKMQARIFDAIWAAKASGIDSDRLVAKLYPGVSTPAAHRTLISHIYHINNLIEDSGYKIRAVLNGRFPGTYKFWSTNDLRRRRDRHQP
jgi:hypothetical protein